MIPSVLDGFEDDSAPLATTWEKFETSCRYWYANIATASTPSIAIRNTTVDEPDSRKKGPQRGKRKGRQPRTVTCYNCQQPGHLWYKFPLKTCCTCDQEGHPAKHCPLNSAESNKQSNSRHGRTPSPETQTGTDFAASSSSNNTTRQVKFQDSVDSNAGNSSRGFQ